LQEVFWVPLSKYQNYIIYVLAFFIPFLLQDTEPTSFYAIFDGHAGKDAANYAVAHLHHNLAKSSKYPTNITLAMQEAFLKTDLAFIEKSRREV
jgi:protein phosphatase 1E